MKTCVPIRARSRYELMNQIELIQGRADVLEIWLDDIVWMPSFVQDIKAKEPKVELLGVCKTPAEHGKFTKDPTKKVQILQDFLKSGGDFIDLDINQNPLRSLKEFPPEKLWLSYHNFERVPENIDEIYSLMNRLNPFGVKFAVTPRTPLEYKEFITFAATNTPKISYYNTAQKPELIVTTMGEKYGTMGRKEIHEQDLSWGAFYALTQKHTTANGQMVLGE